MKALLIIAKNGVPMVKLVPVRAATRHPGGWKGRIRISEDFDEPLPSEILEQMTGEK